MNADKLGGVGMEKQKSGKDKGKGSTHGKRPGKPGKKKPGKKDILAGMPIWYSNLYTKTFEIKV